MKPLKEYIRQLVEQQQSDNDIIQAIVKKFPAEYGLSSAAFASASAFALAADKQNAFWQKYNADEAFRKLMNETYCYHKARDYFDFWLNSLELKEFLREDLKSADVIVIEDDKASAVSLSDVSAALEIAENVEEFKEMVKTAYIIH